MRSKETAFVAVLALAFAAIISGCGKGRSVALAGSDSMQPLVKYWADAYNKANSGAVIRIEDGGTAAGFAALAAGSVDICLASRQATKAEADALKARRGTDIREKVVARDAVAVYVNERNPIDEINLAQLKAVFSGRAANWRQVGGPVEPLVVFGREPGSGTRDWFRAAVLGQDDFAPTVQANRDTATLVAAVAKDLRAVGYGSLAMARGVRVIRVARKASERGVEPSQSTVTAGKYPLSRDLFFYTAGEPAGETATFIGWVMSAEGQKACQDAGYVPAPGKR